MKNNYLEKSLRGRIATSLLAALALLFSFDGQAQCTTPGPGEVSIEIVMQSVSFAGEMYWNLSDSTTGNLIASTTAGTYPTNNTSYDGSYLPQHQLCVTANETLKLDALDSFGDGWNGGTFIVRYNSIKDTVFQYSLSGGGFNPNSGATVYFQVPPPPVIVYTCKGSTAPAFNNNDSISGGSGSFDIIWQESADQVSWTAAPGKNDSISYQSPDTHFSTKYFRRRVIDLTCGDTAYSNVLTLMVPDSLLIDSGTVTNVSCYGQADGEIEAHISGGRPPYIYAWSNGDSTATTDSLSPGTYTLTVTDQTGCTYVDSFTVSQPDPLALSITLQKSVDCPGFNDGELVANPLGGIPPYTFLWSNGDTTALADTISAGTYTVIMTDSNGCQGFDTIVVNDIDTVRPSVVAQNVTTYLSNNGTTLINAMMVENGSSDLCGIRRYSLSDSIFACTHLGTNTRYLIVEDLNGNIDSAAFTVDVLDTITPVARTKNATIYLNASGYAVLTPAMVNSGSSDNCTISLSLSQDTFSCADKGLQLRDLTATDLSGNAHSASFLVDVKDTISPTLVTRTITVQLGATGQASIAASQLDGGSSDNCSNQLFYSASKTIFDCTDLGSNSVSITITDQNANSTSGTATVIVEDNINPSAQAQNLTLSLDANGQGSITPAQANNGSTDNCSIDSMWVSQDQFSCADLGANSLSFTVRDTEGNVNSTNFIVTVQDNIAPTVMTQGQTVYLDTNGQASISTAMINNGSVDNCGISTYSLNRTSFSCNDLGPNTVMLTATDASGNSQSAQATVTVVDTNKPEALVRNITVSLDASGNATISTSMINNGSSDNCQISNMSLSQTSFTCADIGANNVVLTVTDNSGNQSSATAVVMVEDNMAPTVLTQGHTLYLDANGMASITAQDIDNNSFDNCGVASISADITVFDCADLGQNLVILTVTDNEGNSASGSTFVTVFDTITPTIDNLPANITAYANAGQCGTNVQWPTITASDNCNTTSVLSNQLNGSYFPLGITTVVVTASDPSGNSVSQSFTINVQDTVSPVISNIPSSFQIIPNAGSCDAVVNWINPTATDNCGVPSIVSSHSSGATFPLGNTTVTYTATDANGNSSTASFVVTVSDVVAPSISNVPNDTIVSNTPTACEGVVTYPAASVSDNCSGASLSYSHPSGSVFPLGTTTVTITATDGAGNISTATFDVTIEDNVKPRPTFVPQSDTVGICSASYVYPPVTGADNCGTISITQTAGLPSGSIFPIGTTQNVFRIRDAAGNDSIVSFTVTIVPQGQPLITNLLEICANEDPVEISLGQATMVWTGPGIMGGNYFSPRIAGPGRHQLNYTFTDDYNCSVTGVITVTVLPVPLTPVIIQVGTTTLGVQGAYTTYQWYRNGQIIPGAVNSTLPYTVGGNYQVMVGNASGCLNYGAGFVIGTNGGGIGIEELDLTALEVYPNPTDGLINIQINASQRTELQVELMSLEGKLIYQKKSQTSDGGLLSLDFGHLPAATYILRISNDEGVANHRIIIK
ncbi:HYR domain-containing protein [Croceimicrobium hydrocarbonivorans]|uniref:HYR domain-containing protein n=1 Tax=Croceimicrobium hydrocarbonivorans TaxID=2761580 RepID=A0A7H0VIF7_9FLAO|nr:HYR domain-containing protein [Croceimicrobium hydrocarbonivorans]QNR25505.1 HYR domain-containing protein [Croceimicrobium hydrocarbonivorans]